MLSKEIKVYIRFLILIFIDYYLFHLMGKMVGILFLLYIAYNFLKIFGLFTSAEVCTISFPSGIFYKKDYKNDYSKNMPYLEEIKTLVSKDETKKVNGVGFYYDNPQKTKREDCRCSLGIFHEKSHSLKPEYENLLLEKGYKKYEIECSKSLMVEWCYELGITFYFGIMKAYAALNKVLSDKNELRKLRIGNVPKDIVSVEYYEEGKVKFYYPTENVDKFLIYDEKQEIVGEREKAQ